MMKMKIEKGRFNEMEKIRIYLEHHPEVFTDEFMQELADRYLNYYTVRNRIKTLYPSVVRELHENNQIEIIPDCYEEIFNT